MRENNRLMNEWMNEVRQPQNFPKSAQKKHFSMHLSRLTFIYEKRDVMISKSVSSKLSHYMMVLQILLNYQSEQLIHGGCKNASNILLLFKN